MWLTGRLASDFKTIADFRKVNGKAIRGVCRQFVVFCRNLDLFSQSIIAIDGGKFKTVNNRDRNFTQGKVKGNAACGQCAEQSGLGDAAGVDESEFYDKTRSALDGSMQINLAHASVAESLSSLSAFGKDALPAVRC